MHKRAARLRKNARLHCGNVQWKHRQVIIDELENEWKWYKLHALLTWTHTRQWIQSNTTLNSFSVVFILFSLVGFSRDIVTPIFVFVKMLTCLMLIEYLASLKGTLPCLDRKRSPGWLVGWLALCNRLCHVQRQWNTSLFHDSICFDVWSDMTSRRHYRGTYSTRLSMCEGFCIRRYLPAL